MSGFSIMHWLVVVLILALPMIILMVVVAVRSARRTVNAERAVAARLAELERLREHGTITDSEAATERARILREL